MESYMIFRISMVNG